MVRVPNSAPARVLSFMRQNGRDRVFAVFNFSPESRSITFEDDLHHGRYKDYFGRMTVTLSGPSELKMEPWGYRVFTG
jgi:hypothetical protein